MAVGQLRIDQWHERGFHLGQTGSPISEHYPRLRAIEHRGGIGGRDLLSGHRSCGIRTGNGLGVGVPQWEAETDHRAERLVATIIF